jgi:hypothetical protein
MFKPLTYFIVIVIIIIILILDYYITYHYNKNTKQNTNKEGFISTLNYDIQKSYISWESIQPKTYSIGIEQKIKNNDIIDLTINYYRRNIFPFKNVVIDTTENLINYIISGEISMAFVKEYKLLNYINSNPENVTNINVMFPTFNKYIIGFKHINNDLEYLSDLNTMFATSTEIVTIYYLNDEDIEIIDILLYLNKIVTSIMNNINYVKINSLSEINDNNILISLINPNDITDEDYETISPFIFFPRETDINTQNVINELDYNYIEIFHNKIYKSLPWIHKNEIFLNLNMPSYTTFAVRYLLITNDTKLIINKENMKTFINNWHMHKTFLQNIYIVKPGLHATKLPLIGNKEYNDITFIDKRLQFNSTMQEYLINHNKIKIHDTII